MKLIIVGEHKVEPLVAENGQLAKFDISRVETADENLSLMARAGNFLLLGDRSASFAVLKEISQKGAGVIIFDAHIGALPVPLSHDSFLKHLVEVIPPERIILVGFRDLTLEEFSFLKQHNIRNFSMQSMTMESMSAVCDGVMEVASKWASTYISISLDVLDPAFATVGKPSPGGLAARELLYFIQRLRMLRNFLAADVVDFESSPELSAKLLSELSVTKAF
jgi:arginase family enzyme